MLSINNNQYTPPSSRKKLDIKKFNKNKEEVKGLIGNQDFYMICEQAKDHILAIYDKKIQQRASGDTQEDYVNIFHSAMQGIPSSVNLLKKHIEDFVVEQGLRDVEYPMYYQSLVEGLYEESFGWGPLVRFRYELDSEGAQVLGRDIKFKRSWGYELQPFQFRSVEQVLELANRFANMERSSTLNSLTSPELECSTHDNIRVSIMIPERMESEPVITLRRKVVPELNFETISKYQTIPKEAIPIFKLLSGFFVNGVIAGPPGCGKSTFLQVMLHHMLYREKNGEMIPEPINTVYAEKKTEWKVRDLHPRSNILHLIGEGEEFENIIAASILRHDIIRVILGEIREHEVGLFRRASLQGIKQVLGTIHDLDPEDIPGILSSLYMQYFPLNGMDSNEVKRIFARNLHFSITMDEFLHTKNGHERLQKKVTGIHLYDVNPRTKEVEMVTIMDYLPREDSWRFYNNIPQRFKRMVEKYNPVEFENFTSLLDSLEQKHVVMGM